VKALARGEETICVAQPARLNVRMLGNTGGERTMLTDAAYVAS
jgi:hypothetical protein